MSVLFGEMGGRTYEEKTTDSVGLAQTVTTLLVADWFSSHHQIV